MTFGGITMAIERHLVRVQEKGQVTLPAAIRKRLGIKKGDVVAVEATPEGVLITPQYVLALRDLDQIGAILRDQGITLDEWMESGRAIREQLYREKYGDESPTNPD
jgi:AbrB family looped-hinge helix DNA binding protein